MDASLSQEHHLIPSNAQFIGWRIFHWHPSNARTLSGLGYSLFQQTLTSAPLVAILVHNCVKTQSDASIAHVRLVILSEKTTKHVVVSFSINVYLEH